MPSFSDAIDTPAAAEEIWKLLYDPHRLPEWWHGYETIVTDRDHRDDDETTTFTMYPTGYPDFPMPQQMRTDGTDHRIVVSCQVSDLVFCWSLEERAEGGTRITVDVTIPEQEADRLEAQRDIIAQSLRHLARLGSAAGIE